jgi:hypothetical protein
LLGATQGVHDAPHVSIALLLAHAVPHWWNEGLHTNPHVAPSQVGIALAGALHGEHDVPHDIASLSATHDEPHRW